MPVSGEIKSLGAPTFNLKLAVQFVLQARELPVGFFRGDFIVAPALLTVLGAALIVGSGLYTLVREARLRRAARPPLAAAAPLQPRTITPTTTTETTYGTQP